MVRFCSNCGSRAQAGDRFCRECGVGLRALAGAPRSSDSFAILKRAIPKRSALVWLGAGLGAFVLTAVALFYWRPGNVPPSPQPKPQIDEMLKSRLVGHVYEGNLEIEGWEDRGGGLIIAPIWYSQYEREDGAHLVLANVAQPLRPRAMQTTFHIADILLIPALAKGQEVSYFCRLAGQGTTQAIIAIIQPNRDYEEEWWKDVRRAWNISLQSGRIAPIDPDGIECINEGWGL